MIHLGRVDIDVLREAGRSESGLQIFTLHRRLSLGPAQLALLVRSLEKRGLVAVNEDESRISVTEAGIQALSLVGSRRRELQEVEPSSNGMRRPKLGLNYPYIPRRSII